LRIATFYSEVLNNLIITINLIILNVISIVFYLLFSAVQYGVQMVFSRHFKAAEAPEIPVTISHY